jgi:hypothetical protein
MTPRILKHGRRIKWLPMARVVVQSKKLSRQGAASQKTTFISIFVLHLTGSIYIVGRHAQFLLFGFLRLSARKGK